MPATLRFREANGADLDAVLELLNESAQWLLDRGIRQWYVPFPRELIESDFEDHRVFLAISGSDIVATGAALTDDPRFWGDQPPGSWYIHRLARRRGAPGAGRVLLRWNRGPRPTGRTRSHPAGLRRTAAALLRVRRLRTPMAHEPAQRNQRAVTFAVVLLREARRSTLLGIDRQPSTTRRVQSRTIEVVNQQEPALSVTLTRGPGAASSAPPVEDAIWPARRASRVRGKPAQRIREPELAWRSALDAQQLGARDDRRHGPRT